MERDSANRVERDEAGQLDSIAAGRSPRLRLALFQLLHRRDIGEEQLEAELQQLRERYTDVVHAELIHLLSHLSFEPAQAMEHWDRIVRHRRSLQRRLGSTVDLRVALVDYFLQVDPRLENPTIIEMRLFEQTRESAYRDELTGLHNYRFFREQLENELARSRRYGMPVSLLMIDVDDFKAYNDRNGHDAGNDALAGLAHLVTETVRDEDFVTRYGGEELAVLLPFTPKTGARLVAERLRARVERHRFAHGEEQPGGRLTVSVGVATCPADGHVARRLVRCADGALYAAKASGKNRCWLYGDSSRSHRRLEVELCGELRTLASDRHRLTVLQISDGGAQLLGDHHPGVGSLVEVVLSLPDTERHVPVCGRVVYVKETDEGRFEVAIRTVEIASADRCLLRHYLGEPTAESGAVRSHSDSYAS